MEIWPRHWWCFWPFRQFFNFVGCWVGCYSLSLLKCVVEFFDHHMWELCISLTMTAVKKFGGGLCKAKPQCLCLVDAVLFSFQYYRRNAVNDTGDSWAVKAASSSRGLAKLLSHAALYAWALALPSSTNQKSTNDFTWFTCTLVWLESQAPNFCHNPVHSVKLRKTKSICWIISEVVSMWIVERKGFTEGLTDQSDLAADQISQGRVKAGPK